MVRAVLLVPAAGYRGLLAEGPCGYRPPMAWRWDDHDPEGLEWYDHVPVGAEEEMVRALVLAWRGKPLAAGIELAVRHGAWDGTRARVLQRLNGTPHATYVVPPEMGEVIMLDGDGRVVSLETVWAVTP